MTEKIPAILYHSSPRTDLEIITPQPTLSKDVYIGDYVFATADKKHAAMYLATKGIWISMDTNDQYPWIVIRCNQDEYLTNDIGGAIYELPSEFFFKTPQEGLEQYEMASSAPVKPINKTIYQKSVDAMREMNINIYFVDDETFVIHKQAEDEPSFLASLTPFTED